MDSRSVLPIIIAGGNGPLLFGRNWLRAIQLDWNRIPSLLEDHKTAMKLQPNLKLANRCSSSAMRKWLEGNVQQRLGSYLYAAQVGDKLLKQHTNQLPPRTVTNESRRKEATTSTLPAPVFPVPTIQNAIQPTAAAASSQPIEPANSEVTPTVQPTPN